MRVSSETHNQVPEHIKESMKKESSIIEHPEMMTVSGNFTCYMRNYLHEVIRSNTCDINQKERKLKEMANGQVKQENGKTY